MFIRKTKSRNSTCFQIGKKQDGRFVIKQHIGCASTPERIEVLSLKAKQLLHAWKHANQLPLFGIGPHPPAAQLVNWRITGFHQVFGAVYDQIGFPDTLLRDLVVARIVYPKSKTATLRYLDRYLGISVGKNRLFRFLDTLDKDQLTRIAFDFVENHHPQGITICFYDVTTLYFETTAEDDWRQKGFSKDHRMDMPQILIGLFVDSNGYPFDFDFYEGKTFEGHTLVKAITSIRQRYDLVSLTVVADAGMLSADNLAYLDSVKVHYIVGARLKNLPQELTQQILHHPFPKQPILEITVDNQRLVVDHSVNRATRDAQNRDRIITKLKQKLAAKKIVVKKSKYLLTTGKHAILGVDYEQMQADQQFDGLKGYFVNQDNPNQAQDLISQYHQLWQVEKAFRMSKHDLRERPIFHSKPKRIKTHLTLCFASLLVMKETEKQLHTINCSLQQAIELLGKVGQGVVKVGTVELIAESEFDSTTQLILKLFEGH